MQFLARIETPNVTVANFIQSLRNFAREEMRKAISASLGAMLSRIPIRTGFLSGSFIKAVVKYGLAHNPVGFTSRAEYYREGGLKVLKSESSGQQFVEDQFTESPTLFEFDLQNAIIYWRINDFTQKGRGTPWLSIDAGRAAFFDYLQGISTRFPDINELIGKTTVIVRRGSGTPEIIRDEGRVFNR